MSFPNYSTFFKLGLGQGCSGQEQQKKKERKRPLRSFLKLDLVDAPAAHYPSVEPASPVPSCSSSPTSSYVSSVMFSLYFYLTCVLRADHTCTHHQHSRT